MTSAWTKKHALTVAVIATIAQAAAVPARSADEKSASVGLYAHGPYRDEIYSTNRPGPHNDLPMPGGAV